MQKLDNEFFEAYKSLEKLCSDSFDCPHGVSEYITQMEAKDAEGRYRIPDWAQDYRMLKHVRWVRNQIAHESSDTGYCEKEDLAFVREFHSRMLSKGDPLAQLKKPVSRPAQPKPTPKEPAPAEKPKRIVRDDPPAEKTVRKTAAKKTEKASDKPKKTTKKTAAADKKPAKKTTAAKKSPKKKTSRRKSTKKKQNRAPLILFSVLFLLLILAGAAWYFLR